MSKFSRTAALRVAARARKRLGVPADISLYIAFACRRRKLPYAYGYALVAQESGYHHIFGHDAGGLFPGLPVTRQRYQELRNHLRAGSGANGVGLTQITYPGYVLEHGGLWRKRANVYFGINLLCDLIEQLGLTDGIGAYNGGVSNPIASYAAAVQAKAVDIRPKLTKKGHR